MYSQEYLKGIRSKFPSGIIMKQLGNLRDLKVLVVGDTIIDEYVFTLPKGRAIKDPILSLDFEKSERYAGGILAIANHIAGFVDTLSLISVLGDYRREDGFVKASIKANIKAKFFTKKNSPTTSKVRYIDRVRNGKLFKVQYINDEPLDKEEEGKVIAHLKEELPKYDLVVVGDFGHGFITPDIVKTLEKYSKSIAANVQTNSSNMGFNYAHKYSRIDYLTTNEFELRLALCNRFGGMANLIEELRNKVNLKKILLTLGSDGCLYINGANSRQGPTLTNSIKDVVGAGDAVFAVTSLLNHNNVDEELLLFLANCAGAIAVNIIGNKESITREMLMEFAGGLR